MDPMAHLATQFTEGLKRRRAANGWTGRPNRRSIRDRVTRRNRPAGPPAA